jgi:hypothetical protein
MHACVRGVTHDRQMILSNKHALRRWPSMQGSSGGHGWTQCHSRQNASLGKYLEQSELLINITHACKKVIMAERTVSFNVPWRPNVVLTSSEWNSRFLSEWFAHITAAEVVPRSQPRPSVFFVSNLSLMRNLSLT